jgi:hypothetical protein
MCDPQGFRPKAGSVDNSHNFTCLLLSPFRKQLEFFNARKCLKWIQSLRYMQVIESVVTKKSTRSSSSIFLNMTCMYVMYVKWTNMHEASRVWRQVLKLLFWKFNPFRKCNQFAVPRKLKRKVKLPNVQIFSDVFIFFQAQNYCLTNYNTYCMYKFKDEHLG